MCCSDSEDADQTLGFTTTYVTLDISYADVSDADTDTDTDIVIAVYIDHVDNVEDDCLSGALLIFVLLMLLVLLVLFVQLPLPLFG